MAFHGSLLRLCRWLQCRNPWHGIDPDPHFCIIPRICQAALHTRKRQPNTCTSVKRTISSHRSKETNSRLLAEPEQLLREGVPAGTIHYSNLEPALNHPDRPVRHREHRHQLPDTRPKACRLPGVNIVELNEVASQTVHALALCRRILQDPERWGAWTQGALGK